MLLLQDYPVLEGRLARKHRINCISRNSSIVQQNSCTHLMITKHITQKCIVKLDSNVWTRVVFSIAEIVTNMLDHHVIRLMDLPVIRSAS